MDHDELQDLVRTARSSRVKIHAIASEPVQLLQELCAKTGGFFVQRSEPELVRAFEALYANLISHYHVRFRVQIPQADSGSVRLQIFAEQGTAEETFSLPVA